MNSLNCYALSVKFDEVLTHSSILKTVHTGGMEKFYQFQLLIEALDLDITKSDNNKIKANPVKVSLQFI